MQGLADKELGFVCGWKIDGMEGMQLRSDGIW